LTKNLDRSRIEQVVRSHGWLSQTPETFQSQVLANCDLLNLKAGQSLYRAGDASGGVFGVLEGTVAVYVPPHDSRSSLAYVAGPGFWIGDVAAVRGGKRLVTIQAVSRCRLLRLPRAELQRILGKDPVCWSYMALLLAQNFARSIRLISALKLVQPRDRVAAVLLQLVDDMPEGQLKITVSQSNLGSVTNLARSSVNSALKDLEQLGLIRRRYSSVTIVSASELRFCVEEGPLRAGVLQQR
jgi:CRP/FNR family transcriptional regulator, cyclic AMP receptor protein